MRGGGNGSRQLRTITCLEKGDEEEFGQASALSSLLAGSLGSHCFRPTWKRLIRASFCDVFGSGKHAWALYVPSASPCPTSTFEYVSVTGCLSFADPLLLTPPSCTRKRPAKLLGVPVGHRLSASMVDAGPGNPIRSDKSTAQRQKRPHLLAQGTQYAQIDGPWEPRPVEDVCGVEKRPAGPRSDQMERVSGQPLSPQVELRQRDGTAGITPSLSATGHITPLSVELARHVPLQSGRL